MNYIWLGALALLTSGGIMAWTSSLPASAAVFPRMVAAFCFALPGVISLRTGVINGDIKKINPKQIGEHLNQFLTYAKTETFRGVVSLFFLTFLYVAGTFYIGFYPTSVLYFLAVLLVVYKMKIKGALIYSACCIIFLYVFFALIFKISA